MPVALGCFGLALRMRSAESKLGDLSDLIEFGSLKVSGERVRLVWRFPVLRIILDDFMAYRYLKE